MNVNEVAEKLKLEVKVRGNLDRDVRGCYVSDMLSDVLANGQEGNLWITRQTHPNVVAVAAIKGLSGIVITGGKPIDPETLTKAEGEEVPVLATGLSSFEVAGICYNLLAGSGARK
jgi:predicted transcriptional regulator